MFLFYFSLKEEHGQTLCQIHHMQHSDRTRTSDRSNPLVAKTAQILSTRCLNHDVPEVICIDRTHGKHIHLGHICCHDLQWLILRGKGLASADSPN